MKQSMKCESCRRGRLPKLMDGKDGMVCTTCYFAEIVRDDRATLGSFIEECRDNIVCVYCGEWADQMDHVIPRSWELPTYTVPACRDCNGRCSDALCGGLRQKRAFVATLLRKAFGKVLCIPDWDEEELEEMSYSMRTQIMAGLQAKAVAASRIDFAELAV